MLTLDDLSLLKHDENTDRWFAPVRDIADRLGFERVLFGLTQRNHQDCSSVFIADNYPVAWRARYETARYSTIDPVVVHSSLYATPLVWRDDMYCSPAQQVLMEEAQAHGLVHGVSLPMHGPRGEFGVFSFSLDAETASQAHKHIARHIGNLVLLKDMVLQSALPFVSTPAASQVATLTTQEQDILRWCARGKTSWEISVIFGCSEANINFHVGKITRKFGVTTRRAAVLMAASAGLL